MRTRYGLSPWIVQYPDTKRPKFDPLPKGAYDADVVIVGAGLTGALTARLCAKAGLKTLLLEADRAGLGASGRSGGVITSEPDQSFRVVAERLGLKFARQAYQLWDEGAADAAAVIKQLKLQCGPIPADGYVLPWRESEKELRRDHQAKADAGVPGSWVLPVPARRATKLDVTGARKTTHDLLIDPYAATVGVVRAAAAARARVHEKTRVTKITFDRKIARVHVGPTVITTPHVVITTNVATPETKQLKRHVAVRQRFHVLTDPLGAAMKKGLPGPDTVIVDGRTPRRRIRWTGDGRLLISGGDGKVLAGEALTAAQVFQTNELMYETLLMFQGIFGLKPAFGWSSEYGQTLDGLPAIGPHRFFPHHLLALAGSGDSLTDAFIASKVMFRAVMGKTEKADAAFTWQRLGS